MPRPCETCAHPDKIAIDKKLLGGHAVVPLARKHSLAPSSLQRHKKLHVIRKAEPGQVGTDDEFEAWLDRRKLESASDVLTYAKMCVFRMERLADRAEADGDIATAMKGLSATMKSMESLFAKVTGLINDGPAVDASTKVVAVLAGLSDAQILAFINANATKELTTHDAGT